MQALAWWAIPIIATSVAIVWAIFAARPKGPADAHRTVAEHLAFRSALQTGHVRVQPTDQSTDQGTESLDQTGVRPNAQPTPPERPDQASSRPS